MHIDVFKNDAFSLSSLTATINNLPYKPGRIGSLGLFEERGISTLTVSIESRDGVLSLVPAAPRGASGKVYDATKRKMRDFRAVHLPQRATITADEIQNLRAFGAEAEVQTMADYVAQRLADMRQDIDVTHEYHRIGAIKGQVLDADGSTVLLDLYSAFGVVQITQSYELDQAGTKVRELVLGTKRAIENELGAVPYTGIRAFCSEQFFDALISHQDVRAAYERWQDGDMLRNDPRAGFPFAGIMFEEYRGSVGGNDFIPDNQAFVVPEGVRGLFISRFAPADYMETVNTIGVPYYAKQEPLDFGKGVDVEAQSNPLHMCTRPRSIIRLTLT